MNWFQNSPLTLIAIILCLLLALVFVAIKVTQKTNLLKTFHQSRQKFETLVNSIDGVVWEANPETFQFTFVSQQAGRLLDFPITDWLNIPAFWTEQLHKDDSDRAVNSRREAVAEKKACRAEYRMMAASGREVWIRESAAVVVENDKATLIRGVLLDITEQKLAEQKFKTMNQELLDTSRRAGMAEVATGVLHNVGNVLNSVNVSATLISDQIRQSKISNLAKGMLLLRKHATDLGTFLTVDPKGKMLPEYLIGVSQHLEKEQAKLLQALSHMIENVTHIKDIVVMQQTYARVGGVVETLAAADLIEEALQINAASFARHGIEVARNFPEVPPVAVEKHKVLQILINLASNAEYALAASGRGDKKLTLGIAANGDNRLKITVNDNGIGIPPENLTKIFSHGFTTKPKGHGFGLHSSALAAKEMGGSLSAQSEGAGCGATFILELPMVPKAK